MNDHRIPPDSTSSCKQSNHTFLQQLTYVLRNADLWWVHPEYTASGPLERLLSSFDSFDALRFAA